MAEPNDTIDEVFATEGAQTPQTLRTRLLAALDDAGYEVAEVAP